MNKIIIALVVVVIVVAGFFLYNSFKAPAVNRSVDNTQNINTNTNQQIPSQNSTESIIIKNFAFSPSSITINVGTTVVWTNEDSMPHRIKSDSFFSSVLGKGATFQQTFSAPGTYKYICSIHPSMNGEIIVK